MFQRLWYWYWRTLLGLAIAAAYRLRAYGRHRLPRSGGVLLAVSHQSYLDPILAGVALSGMTLFLARRTLFRNPVFGWILRSVKAQPISREGLDTGAIRVAVDWLRAGGRMLLFPEGTRSRDGSVGPVRGGVSLLAKRAAAAVVPVAIEGAFEAWPRSGGLRLFVPILVGYGEPIRPDEVARMTREELQQRIRDDLVRLHAELKAKRGVG